MCYDIPNWVNDYSTATSDSAHDEYNADNYIIVTVALAPKAHAAPESELSAASESGGCPCSRENVREGERNRMIIRFVISIMVTDCALPALGTTERQGIEPSCPVLYALSSL